MLHHKVEVHWPGNLLGFSLWSLTLAHVPLDHVHNSLGISEVPNCNDRHVLWPVPALVEGQYFGGRNALDDVLLAYRQPFCVLQSDQLGKDC